MARTQITALEQKAVTEIELSCLKAQERVARECRVGQWRHQRLDARERFNE
jgi:hypothetical protein